MPRGSESNYNIHLTLKLKHGITGPGKKNDCQPGARTMVGRELEAAHLITGPGCSQHCGELQALDVLDARRHDEEVPVLRGFLDVAAAWAPRLS